MSTTTYEFVYYTFEGPEHEYGFEQSDSGSDAGSEYRGAGDEESLVPRRSPSPLPSPPSPALSSVSSSDSLSSYETCSDFEAEPLPESDPTPWYLRPTPSPVFPTSPSFEFELSFYTAVGGNDSLFDEEDRAALFPEEFSTTREATPVEQGAATPRCADFYDGSVKTEQVSPLLSWNDFPAMQRSSTGDSGTLVNESRSPTGSCSGSDSGWAPGQSHPETSESCGWSTDEGYEADSESRLASASLRRSTTSSRQAGKRTNLKRKRGHRDEGEGGDRVFVPGGRFDDEDDGEGPALKKRKADPPTERGGWQEQMKKMQADGTFGAVIPGRTFLQMVLQVLNRQ